VESHQEALRALAVAQRHGLTAAGQDLARRLSSAAAEAGQLAVALQWALRAHDPALCAELVAPLAGKVQQQLLAQVGCCVHVLRVVRRAWLPRTRIVSHAT
jgi:hypothetical protein